MPQLVFIHGPGAGGCADAWAPQLEHFPGSVGPTLPGHLEGTRCADVRGYVEWVRGWLWAQGLHKDLLLCGFTLGAAIALEYALDYPDEVAGLALMTVSMHATTAAPGVLELRLKAAEDAEAYEQWIARQRQAMKWVDPVLAERLMERHRQVGPLSQYHDLVMLRAFDVHERIGSLQPKLLLVRGEDDPIHGREGEREIHEAVPGSTYVRLPKAGHFPALENPAEFNEHLETFAASL
ncbi:MAG: alpha/beta hydrolase [Dehalococcoidia bacterium]